MPVDRVTAATRALLPGDRVAEVRRVQGPPPSPADAAQPAVVPPGAPQPVTSCGLYAVLPKERECPYWEIGGELSAEQKRAARRDERCTDGFGSWSTSPLGTDMI